MTKRRLDMTMAERGLVASRSQAESYIRLGQVKVNGHVADKAGLLVAETDDIQLSVAEQYVSRAALKLKSAAEAFHLDFVGKTVLDVGSSTGGFTHYALTHGAGKVIAIDVGTDQLHPSLRTEPRIELHEKTDIRSVVLRHSEQSEESPGKMLRSAQHDGREWTYIQDRPDIVVVDVSFISLREILPHIAHLVTHDAMVVAMVKPQFEAAQSNLKHKGVIKNDHMRRDILKEFEVWVKTYYNVVNKVDSAVAGSKGNLERFYLLRKVAGR
ncbi:MAG TPA: TlyA family RNA methyltransferase [Candidatus Saccharimonadales bacterium]|nr:TlyA family RNA methyltransferase [Candidatus Saccharimonadales bacterium]